MPARRRSITVAFVALIVIAGCSSSGSRVSTATTVPSSTTSTVPASPTSPSTARTCTSLADIDAWPLARRVAQVIAIPSLDFNVESLASMLRDAGGVLFLGSNPAPANLGSRIAAAMAGGDRASKPLVMADVEGGGVQRLHGLVDPFPWARDLAARSPAEIRAVARLVGQQMMRAGVNVDLAPVVDLDDRPGPSATNPDGRRSFSLDPDTTARDASAFVQGLRDAGVLAVLKHFPGLGGSTRNTDFGPAATLPYSALRAAGLRPFRAGIAAGAPSIMLSNATTPGLSNQPASVSSTVIVDLLRKQMGFGGLVMTDSLSAGALTAAGYTVPQAAVAAITAGADLVLFGSTLTPADTALLQPDHVHATRDDIARALATAVRSGALSRQRLDDAVAHVLRAKAVTMCAN
ncbi:MAG TPA: glycoside hydrolase family 3 N-terminal domain-containing protein [Acidimicrobiia bacterium]|nr:glycoside hydrolase family 3 N-terminal domain-containing protein [Acidimicrobiia bacterium]